jgi:hypothetical protein
MREKLKARLDLLRATQDQLRAQLNAALGASQEVENTLRLMDEEEAERAAAEAQAAEEAANGESAALREAEMADAA